MKHTTTLFVILFSIAIHSLAQENTLKFTEGTKSPSATLQDVSWISGSWKGEAFGGITEEIWSPPLGDSMMFAYKLVADNKVVFYELGGIRQIDDTLIFQLKHFGNDFKGWEEKDETIDAKLVKIEKNRVYFDQFTFEKINENEINIYVIVEDNGKSEEIKFNYKRE
ncbi:hypothetical protein KO494_01640 [Lacinutrix sp. C3R15]|uniref:DUF6265 family protein n=1 Tax=Flavobacteriaceae TaxID=49546 RepID=UPI001C080715|nr:MULTISPECIES: DUF6265 family protein [Flavobacteriaceae]MBU2938231.1 hypothetical protein [Lacinutrix sp. C3R15]MDO6621545.1 DUF6265 family protein [Oceanihabitans sp. 1_MG-2023]